MAGSAVRRRLSLRPFGPTPACTFPKRQPEHQPLCSARVHLYSLDPYTWEQQQTVLFQQLSSAGVEGEGEGDGPTPALEFVNYIFDYTKAKAGMDGVYSRLDRDDCELLSSDQYRDFDNSTTCPQVDRRGQPVESGEALLAAGAACFREISLTMEGVARGVGLYKKGVSKTGIGLVIPALKGLPRIEEKALDYSNNAALDGPGASHVLDVVRFSVACADVGQALKVLEALGDTSLCLSIVRIKNFFWKLDDIHYRRLQCVVMQECTSSGGVPYHLFEVQIQLEPIYNYRNNNMDICRKPYEYFRKLVPEKKAMKVSDAPLIRGLRTSFANLSLRKHVTVIALRCFNKARRLHCRFLAPIRMF